MLSTTWPFDTYIIYDYLTWQHRGQECDNTVFSTKRQSVPSLLCTLNVSRHLTCCWAVWRSWSVEISEKYWQPRSMPCKVWRLQHFRSGYPMGGTGRWRSWSRGGSTNWSPPAASLSTPPGELDSVGREKKNSLTSPKVKKIVTRKWHTLAKRSGYTIGSGRCLVVWYALWTIVMKVLGLNPVRFHYSLPFRSRRLGHSKLRKCKTNKQNKRHNKIVNKQNKKEIK